MIVVGQIYRAKLKTSNMHYEVISILGRTRNLYTLSCLSAPFIYNLYAEEIANDFELIDNNLYMPLDKAMDKVAGMFDDSDMSSKVDHKGNWIPKKQWDKLYCSCSEKEEKVINIGGDILVVCLTCHKEIIK